MNMLQTAPAGTHYAESRRPDVSFNVFNIISSTEHKLNLTLYLINSTNLNVISYNIMMWRKYYTIVTAIYHFLDYISKAVYVNIIIYTI